MKKVSLLFLLLFVSIILSSCRSTRPGEIKVDRDVFLDILTSYKDKIHAIYFRTTPPMDPRPLIEAHKLMYTPEDFSAYYTNDFNINEEYYYLEWIHELDSIVSDLNNMNTFKTGDYVRYGLDKSYKIHIFENSVNIIKAETNKTNSGKLIDRYTILNVMKNDDDKISVKFLKYAEPTEDNPDYQYYEYNEGESAFLIKHNSIIEYKHHDIQSGISFNYEFIPNSSTTFTEHYRLSDTTNHMIQTLMFENDKLKSTSLNFTRNMNTVFNYFERPSDATVSLTWQMIEVSGWDYVSVGEKSEWRDYIGNYISKDDVEYFKDDEIRVYVNNKVPHLFLTKIVNKSELTDELINLNLYDLQFNYTSINKHFIQTKQDTFLTLHESYNTYQSINLNSNTGFKDVLNKLVLELNIR